MCDAIAIVSNPAYVFSHLPWGVLLQIYAYSGHADKFLSHHEEFLGVLRERGNDYEPRSACRSLQSI